MARAPSRRTHAARRTDGAAGACRSAKPAQTAARAAGFSDVHSADGDGGDLARLAAARFAGAAGRCSISPAKSAPAIWAANWPRAASRWRPSSSIAPSRRRHFRTMCGPRWRRAQIDGVLHFSRRSVESYLDCARDLPAGARTHPLLPVGAGGASRCRPPARPNIRMAAKPDEAGMLALVTSRP